MSLDVYLDGSEECIGACVCPNCSHEHEHAYFPKLYNANITHNLTQMASACDLYMCLWRPEQIDIKYARSLIPRLEKGLRHLQEAPEYYQKYNSQNGYGKYEDFVKFVTEYLYACKEYPDATVRVCR